MKTAILEHTHKHGHDTYVAMVGDLATIKDADAIIEAMVRENDIDYVKDDGEDLELRLERDDEMTVLQIGFQPVPVISQGLWRYSEEAEEVTTSPIGYLEGSKRVCRVENSLKPRGEVAANGRAIAAVPEMLACVAALRQIVKWKDDPVINEAIDWAAARAALNVLPEV